MKPTHYIFGNHSRQDNCRMREVLEPSPGDSGIPRVFPLEVG